MTQPRQLCKIGHVHGIRDLAQGERDDKVCVWSKLPAPHTASQEQHASLCIDRHECSDTRLCEAPARSSRLGTMWGLDGACDVIALSLGLTVSLTRTFHTCVHVRVEFVRECLAYATRAARFWHHSLQVR